VRLRLAGVANEGEMEIIWVAAPRDFARLERLVFDSFGQHDARPGIRNYCGSQCSRSAGTHKCHPNSRSSHETALRVGHDRIHELPAIRNQPAQRQREPSWSMLPAVRWSIVSMGLLTRYLLPLADLPRASIIFLRGSRDRRLVRWRIVPTR